MFITRILGEELNGQWSRQWTELHPGHATAKEIFLGRCLDGTRLSTTT